MAKKLFLNLSKKNNCYAQFGVATIFYKNDNPFYNLDSASKYAALSYNYFSVLSKEKKFYSFVINKLSIQNLIDSIAQKKFSLIKNQTNTSVYEDFVTKNYLANSTILMQAINARDELNFNATTKINTSKATQDFINLYPESNYLQQAINLKTEQIYYEQTATNTENAYYSYILAYPNSKFVAKAHENLFLIAKQNNDTVALTKFVYSQPQAVQKNEAWKLLFALSVKDYTNESLKKFIATHPNFPFKDNIINELQINNITLYPYLKNDYFGFLDSSLNIVIPAIYDEVSNFSEGLYVVSKNDTCFYINKKNETIFNTNYKEAYNFNSGIAAIKHANNNWYFINRQAQVISDAYEEINELSDNLYVVKQNGKYGAVNKYGIKQIDTQFEQLGNFKNGYAYFQNQQKFGLIAHTGYTYNALFDWVSDVNTDTFAIAKNNNKFGIIKPNTLILELNYDLVLEIKDNIYILVLNNKYGFYNAKSKCFVTQITFDFLKDKPADFYYKNNLFKLIKNKQVALIDANGRISIDYGVYDEIHFASNNLIKVKRNSKYGFVDRKLNLIIPYKYQSAGDFKDSIAIVQHKNKYALLSLFGKEIYESETEISKISQHFYLANNSTLIDMNGKIRFTEIENIQKVNNNILIITFKNQSIQLINDYF